MKKTACLAVWMLGAAAGTAAAADVTAGPIAEKGTADVPALIQALKSAEMGPRWNAALLLGEIADKAAVGALRECVEKDANPRVRRRAIAALGKLGDQSTLPVLIAALKDDDRFVRRDAARALGELGDQAALPDLIALLKDQEGFVRRDAARALGDLGDASAIPALLELSKEHAETYSLDAPLAPEEMSPAAREAFFALGKLGGAAGAPALGAVLQHTTARVRARAALALGACGESSIPLLTGAVADADLNVRLAAIAGLRQVGGTAGAAGVIKALESDDDATLRAAANALAELGDKSAVPALRAAAASLRAKHPKSRLVAVMNNAAKSVESKQTP